MKPRIVTWKEKKKEPASAHPNVEEARTEETTKLYSDLVAFTFSSLAIVSALAERKIIPNGRWLIRLKRFNLYCGGVVNNGYTILASARSQKARQRWLEAFKKKEENLNEKEKELRKAFYQQEKDFEINKRKYFAKLAGALIKIYGMRGRLPCLLTSTMAAYLGCLQSWKKINPRDENGKEITLEVEVAGN